MMAGHPHALPCGTCPHWTTRIGEDSGGGAAGAGVTTRHAAGVSCRSGRPDWSIAMARGLTHTRSRPTAIQTCVANGMAFLSRATNPLVPALLKKRKGTEPLHTARAPQTAVRALVFSARCVTVKGGIH